MPEVASGILKKTKTGAGVLRDPILSFQTGEHEVRVSAGLIQEFKLVEGVAVVGPVQKDNGTSTLADVESICGLKPHDYRARTPYAELIAINPTDRFHLSASGEISMRIIDLMAPIAKGTRGLIVSPPRAGKTMLLKQIAQAIRQDTPDTRIIVLLVDERPEEVTDFQRSVEAEVLASTSDQSFTEQVELTELLLAHIRADLECGRDVVVLVDSLTRMGRAFNLKGSGTRRTMSGGMEAGAMEIPRRFFGLARNIENGGSVTIIATALIDTGSRMDEVIFEEFKGTGNSEIVLDRRLADSRIFPAINITKSGTRREEYLHSPDDIQRLHLLRRALAGRQPKEALEKLLQLLEKYPTNEKLLNNIRLKG
ncbi:transcription termination factor Rho [Candidatus Zixiibacteriota bacterium]